MSQEEYKSFKLSGILKKVLYKNDETKYIIAVLENNQKICGVYFDTDIEKIVGEEVILKGNWITHKKYGVQFEFDTLQLKEAEIFFFLTEIVKGVGKKFAHDLLEKYAPKYKMKFYEVQVQARTLQLRLEILRAFLRVLSLQEGTDHLN